MKKCPYCGTWLKDYVTFCPRCKNKLVDGQTRRNKRKPRTGAALIAVLVVLLLAGGIGMFVFFGRKRDASSEEDIQTAANSSENNQNTEQEAEDPPEPDQQTGQTQETPQNTEQETPQDTGQETPQDTEQVVQSDEAQGSSGEETGSEDTVSEETISEESAAVSSGKAKGAAAEPDSYLYYFRAMLEGDELALYDALYEISRVDTETAEKELYVSVFPGSDEFSDMFAKARSFMAADHPELFYISYFHYQYWNDPDENGSYRVILSANDFVPSDYEQEVEEMERAADELLSQVDTSRSPAGIALEIHDRIMDLVQYDYDTYESGSDHDLAHYAYGALVANSSGEPNLAVCSGYAAAYEYLLQKEGILCLVINGDTWSESDEGGSHSWNLVELDGDWYETDCTWDDNIHDSHGEEDGILEEAINDDYYRNTIEHYLFQVTTETIENFDPGDDYTYESENGWATFLGKCGRTRNNRDNVDETYDYATIYAPVAEGTKYSYDNIR